MYIHVYQIIKNQGPGPYNSLHHANNRKYFSGLSNTKSMGSTQVSLGKGSGKIWRCSCWEKGNFILISEFKYGQMYKIWPSPLSLSLYRTFKSKLQIFLAANYIALFLPDTNNCFFIWIVPYIHICFYYFLILCFYFHLSSLLLMKHILDFTMFHIIPLQTARNITEIKNTS